MAPLLFMETKTTFSVPFLFKVRGRYVTTGDIMPNGVSRGAVEIARKTFGRGRYQVILYRDYNDIYVSFIDMAYSPRGFISAYWLPLFWNRYYAKSGLMFDEDRGLSPQEVSRIGKWIKEVC